jgi:hypothetical protein
MVNSFSFKVKIASDDYDFEQESKILAEAFEEVCRGMLSDGEFLSTANDVFIQALAAKIYMD